MDTRLANILALTLLVASLIAGALLWDRLPDPMASHWNLNDQVDGSISRFWGVFMVPIIGLGMLLLFQILPAIDPLKANISRFRATFNIFIVLILLFLEYIWALTLRWNLGYTDFKMSTSMLPAMGLLFIFMGYLLRKAKRNFFIGIRTPWTLSSDRVWDETHRLGSVLFYASGLLALLGSFAGGPVAFLLVILPLMASSLLLVIYSYVLYRRETKA